MTNEKSHAQGDSRTTTGHDAGANPGQGKHQDERQGNNPGDRQDREHDKNPGDRKDPEMNKKQGDRNNADANKKPEMGHKPADRQQQTGQTKR